MDLKDILDLLNSFKQRATYGAIAKILGTSARSLMSPYPRKPRYSFVVRKNTHLPTGYVATEMHSNLLDRPHVLDDEQSLRAWLRRPY